MIKAGWGMGSFYQGNIELSCRKRMHEFDHYSEIKFGRIPSIYWPWLKPQVKNVISSVNLWLSPKLPPARTKQTYVRIWLTMMLYCCHRLAKFTFPLTLSLLPMWTKVKSWRTRPMYGIRGGLNQKKNKTVCLSVRSGGFIVVWETAERTWSEPGLLGRPWTIRWSLW